MNKKTDIEIQPQTANKIDLTHGEDKVVSNDTAHNNVWDVFPSIATVILLATSDKYEQKN